MLIHGNGVLILCNSVVRGYHVSKDFRVTVDGEVLQYQQETSNRHDLFAVAILKDGITVGHVPRKISHYSWEDTELFDACDTQKVECKVSWFKDYLWKNEN